MRKSFMEGSAKGKIKINRFWHESCCQSSQIRGQKLGFEY